MNVPGRDDGDDGGGADGADDGDGGKKNHGNAKPFDLAAFHQLRLERLENQRRAEEQSRRRDVRTGRLRWGSTAGLPSSAMNSSLKTLQIGSLRASNASMGKNAVAKLSARQELLRLGQRYASFAPSIQQSNLYLTLSEHTSRGSWTENVVSEQAALSSPAVSEIGSSSAAPEEAAIHHSAHLIDIDSRSSSVPMEALQQRNNVISAATPVCKGTTAEDAGVYSSHYLLLARANSSPTPIPNMDHNGNDANIIDADDGSSSASCNTPTPNLQAASACNSHGENEDGGEVQEDAESEADHFSSFCKAQVLISEIEDKQIEVVSVDPSDGNQINENLVQSRRIKVQRIVSRAVQYILVIFAGAALLFCWRHIVIWYSITYPALRCHLTSHLIMWVEVVRRTAVSTYIDWTKDIDMLSWIIQNIYRIKKLYYDAFQLFNETKVRFLVVQESSAVALNATMSVAILCWQKLDLYPPSPSYFFSKSNEQIVIGKSTLTTPLISCSFDRCLSKTMGNKTLALSGNVDDIKSTSETSSPQFWRKLAKGTPFVRHQLPSIKHDFRQCMHSIPSLGTQPEGGHLLTTQWDGSMNPALDERRHTRGRSNILSPAAGLSRSRLSLNSHRLDTISICADIRRILEIMKQSKSRRTERTLQQNPLHPVTTKRNYYASSYQPQQWEKPLEKDIFDDVDVMGMARDFVGQLLRRKSSNKRQRVKSRV